MHHTRDTCAVITVTNTSDKPVNCKLKMEEKVSRIYSETVFSLDPAIVETDSIVLFANLNRDILRLAPTAHPVNAKVTLEPRTLISTRREIRTSPAFKVYGLRVINWADGVEQAAAFVCPGDKLVQDFVTRVRTFYESEKYVFIINEKISTAAQIFNALGKYGIRYQVDPHAPYAQVQRELDTIQYPFDLLTSKQGDCDDTTVLFASLLEFCGIRTAFVDVPNHIFLMFDTGIHENDRLKLCVQEDRYVIKDHHVWLPVETTKFGESFMEAWRLVHEYFIGLIKKPFYRSPMFIRPGGIGICRSIFRMRNRP